jgi:hypothetical protein
MFVPSGGREAAERTHGLLQFEQPGLARDRERSERGPRGDCARIDAGEHLRVRRRIVLRMRDLPRQPLEQVALARGRVA